MSAYATLNDLYAYGAPQTAFGSLSDATKNAALADASDEVDERFGGRYALPLITWSISITRYTAVIAAYNLLVVRGYNPAAGADPAFETRYNRTLRDLELVQKQQLHPVVTPQTTQNTIYAQPTVISSSVVSMDTGSTDQNRGW
jgi:phage gp36-like protein